MDDRLRQSETTEIVLRQSGTKTDTEEWPNSSSSHTCPKKVYFYSYEIFWSWSQACSQHIWHANLSVSDDNLGLAVEVQLLKLPMCSSLGQVSSSHYKGGRKGEKKKILTVREEAEGAKPWWWRWGSWRRRDPLAGRGAARGWSPPLARCWKQKEPVLSNIPDPEGVAIVMCWRKPDMQIGDVQ